MKMTELEELIEIYNELEPRGERHIDAEEIKACIVDHTNNKEIEFFTNMVIEKIDRISGGGRDDER